jgi:hypothetical protein
MGMAYNYGNPYMNSWYSWGGYPSYGYGGYGGYYYNPTVVVVNNGGDGGRNVVYGKRASHGGMVTTPQEASYTRSRTNYTATVTPDQAGGRVSTSGRTTQRQEDYYNRSWRGSQQNNSYQQSQNRSSSFDPWSGNSNRDSYNRDTNSSYSSPSRSSSSYDGGGTRQSAPASSGSNGRTRGRD